MIKASANLMLPTSIIGSLPRPAWYTANLGSQSFLEAMVNARYREQYEDAVSAHLRAQETAGLDICTDGDAHYDEQVGGMSWQSYAPTHMAGFDRPAADRLQRRRAAAYPRGHILHDFLEARVLPKIVGPGRPRQPAICGDVEGGAAHDDEAGQVRHHPARISGGLGRRRLLQGPGRAHPGPQRRAQSASSMTLADAGCPVIQIEEPQIHMVPVRGKAFGRLDTEELVAIFNSTVKGLRAKTEVWCHTCWGNPSQQRIFKDVQSYQPTLEALDQVDADALTFETCSSGTGDLEAIGR